MRMMTARSLNEEDIVVFFIATNVIVAGFSFFFMIMEMAPHPQGF